MATKPLFGGYSTDAELARIQRDIDQAAMAKMGAIGNAAIAGSSAMGIGGVINQGIFTNDVFQPFGPITQHTMLYHASVEKAENGFLLKIQHTQNGPTKMYVAADTEELQRVFVAAIVGERISK